MKICDWKDLVVPWWELKTSIDFVICMRSFTNVPLFQIDKPAIHYAPVHYAAPIIKTYTPHYAYAAAPLAYSSPYAYGHHSHYYR